MDMMMYEVAKLRMQEFIEDAKKARMLKSLEDSKSPRFSMKKTRWSLSSIFGKFKIL
ncbi:MAG: hypothetical protein ACE5HW_01815 [Candidatus Methanofastidiosia archaeon]